MQWQSESLAAGQGVRKLPADPQYHTGRNYNADPAPKEALAPAHKDWTIYMYLVNSVSGAKLENLVMLLSVCPCFTLYFFMWLFTFIVSKIVLPKTVKYLFIWIQP